MYQYDTMFSPMTYIFSIHICLLQLTSDLGWLKEWEIILHSMHEKRKKKKEKSTVKMQYFSQFLTCITDATFF